jgi:hypothetical protein
MTQSMELGGNKDITKLVSVRSCIPATRNVVEWVGKGLTEQPNASLDHSVIWL